MSDHDTKILASVRSGDEAALVEFMQANQAALLAFIRSRVSTRLGRKIDPFLPPDAQSSSPIR